MAQKKPKSKNVRNVLVAPFSIQWSESNPEGVASLQKTLEELLPLAKLEKKSFKPHYKCKTKEKSPPDISSEKKQVNNFRTYLAPGFQAVIRGLEKNELCCVLLSSDISPPMIMRIVCSYCNTYNVPLVIVPKLKTITSSTLGFPTMTLGFKKEAESPENKFFLIYEMVTQNRCIFETPFIANSKESIDPDESEKSVTRNETSCGSLVGTKDVYLYREGKNERVFRPGIGMKSSEESPVQHLPKCNMDEDFIGFNKSESESLDFKNINIQTMKMTSQSDSDDDDSESDSHLDEGAFFVDNKPDHVLLEVGTTNNERTDSNGRLKDISFSKTKTKKKDKAVNDRYFSSTLNQDVKSKKTKNKGKNIFKHKNKNVIKPDRSDSTNKLNSSTFKPLTIKTIVGNPKKIKRKKK